MPPDSTPKTKEIKAGNLTFNYIYPEKVEGATLYSPNIILAARLILEAKSREELDAAGRIYIEVVLLETQFLRPPE